MLPSGLDDTAKVMWFTSILAIPKTLLGLSKAALSSFLDNNGMRMSASLAYFTIFSLAPLMVITIAIVGWVFGAKAASDGINREIQGFVGQDAGKMIQTMIQSAHRPAQGAIASIVGVVTLLFGATGVFAEIRDSLNNIWRVEVTTHNGVWSWFKSRFLSVGMVLAVGFLLLVSLVVSAILAAMFKYCGSLISVPEFFLHAVEFVISLSVVTGLFALMFAILPEAKLGWGDVEFGALATAILFTVGKSIVGVYLGKTISTSTYGAAASVVVVVAWVYYSALIFYFGAELTRAYATRFGSMVEVAAASSSLTNTKPKAKAAAASA
jgi:membrane protein